MRILRRIFGPETEERSRRRKDQIISFTVFYSSFYIITIGKQGKGYGLDM
jgi:hypothetical protein